MADPVVKKQKDVQAQPQIEQSAEKLILNLYLDVASRKLNMADAGVKIREFVNALPEDKQEEFKSKAREWGRFLALVGEAFATELTVIGAGQ